jgi:hypothetical protein
MEEEHALELAQIETGSKRPSPAAEAQRRRERIFLPVAVLLAAFSLLAIFWFVTYETTAIATVPPQEVEVFTPLTPTPVPSPTVDNNQLGAPIPHPIEGQEQCSTCHGPNGVRPYPADHVDRPDESCQVCHSPGVAADAGASAAIAAGIPHAVEGREQCSQCHGDDASLAPMPVGHIQPVEDATCTLCHQPIAGAGDVQMPAANPIPHPVGEDPYGDCMACHGADKMKPFPENHASFTVDSCTSCHQPAPAEPAGAEATPEGAATSAATPGGETEATPSGPKPIPHPIEGEAYADCTVCHGIDKMQPFPENHTSFASDGCTACHQPAAAAGGTPDVTVEATQTTTLEAGTDTTPEATPATTPEAGVDATPETTPETTPEATPAATPGAGEDTAPASGPKPIPHSIVDAAYQDCTACHGTGQLKPYPPSHEIFPNSTCAGCHQPVVEQ